MKRFKYFFRKFRYNRKRKSLAGVLVLLCLSLTLGFAYLTTELNINGVVNIASSRWDIHFENIEISPESVTATTNPTISNDTTITFATTLEKPGDFYEFTTDIVNDGTYDAKIDSIALSPTLTNEEEEFFEYKIDYTDGGTVQVDDALDAGTSENIRVLFKYKDNADSSAYPEEDTNFTVEVTITYVQGTGNPVQHTSLYSVLKTAAEDGTYATEYTGSHQDSMAGVGSKKIYHWYAPSTSSGNTKGNQIADMNNVIFAGQCWKMMRTTDTGGVKMIYNGVPNDGKCTSSAITIGSDYYTPSVSGQYPGYSGNLQASSVGYMNNGKYLYTASTDINHTVDIPIYYDILYDSNSVISFGPTPDPDDAPAGSVYEDVPYNPDGYGDYDDEYYYSNLEGLYLYETPDYPSYEGPFYVIRDDSEYDDGMGTTAPLLALIPLGLSTIDPNMEIILGESYTYSNGVYTLQDTQSPTFYDWYHNHLIWETGDYYRGYYTCEGENDNIIGGKETCTNIHYIVTSNEDSFNYISSEDEDLYASGFTYNSTTNEYTLNSDRINYWNKSLTTSEAQFNTHRYTCLNKTATCRYLAYIVAKKANDSDQTILALLKDGESIQDAINNTTSANNINLYDSPVKARVDTWYSNNLLNTDYANQLEDTIYCNNRNVSSLGYFDPNGADLEADDNSLIFSGRNSLNNLSCPNMQDRFSLANSQAQLTYPIALPTASEINLMGNRNVLASNNISWTMTPHSLYYYYYMYTMGGYPITSTSTYRGFGTYGVRPVISLKPRTLYASGNGSKNNPYVVE